MSRLLDNTDGIPELSAHVGFCNFCEEQFPKSSLGWLAGRTACPGCREEQDRLAAYRSSEIANAVESDRTTIDVLEVEDRVDRAFRYGSAAFRWVTYSAGAAFATQEPIAAYLLFGVVMADFATWMFTAWIDFRKRMWAVLAEFLGFAALTNVMLHTDLLDVPSDGESFAVAFLAFMLFFTVKGSLAIVHRMQD